MKALHERIRMPDEATVLTRLMKPPRFDAFWHRHPELELTRIEAGSGQRMVGASIAGFTAGDLVLVGPGLPHTWRSVGETVGGCRASVVQFRREPVAAAVAAFAELGPVASLLEASAAGLWFPAHAAARELDTLMTAGSTRVPGLLLDVLAVLSRVDAEPLDASRVGRAAVERPDPRVEAMVRLLHERAADAAAPQMAELASAATLSESAAARRFKRAMGRTATSYLQGLRVAAACDLLRTSDEPVTEVALASGFGNLSHFHRVFRRETGQTPAAWRTRVRGLR